MVRLVAGPPGTVALDLTGRAPGRGAYLHPEPGCIELARRRGGLARALRTPVVEDVWLRLTALAAPPPAPFAP